MQSEMEVRVEARFALQESVVREVGLRQSALVVVQLTQGLCDQVGADL
ncbi:MAG: hypothetical protein V2A74_03980 [bacterium]